MKPIRKIGIGVLAAIMVLGLAFGAQATQTINFAPGGEVNLWNIIDGWTGLSLNQTALENATVLEMLPAGSYDLINYAKYAAFTQKLSVPSGNLLNLTGGNVNNAANITFSEGSLFGFTDTAAGSLILTTQNQNGPGNQSNGFIFDLYALSGNNAAFAGEYIVAFEDGGNSSRRAYGDKDYNDLVGRVSTVPVPPSALLMGSGLFGLGLLGWRRRLFGQA